MRYKTTIQAHVKEQVVSTRTTCDGCGRDVDDGSWDERNEVTIGAQLGDVFPNADLRTAYDLDVCKQCFLEKVVPALASAGLTFRTHDVDDDDRVFEQPLAGGS